MAQYPISFVYLTISYNDREGLFSTAKSLAAKKSDAKWIISDGGSNFFDAAFAKELSEIYPVFRWKSNRDKGIYPAMNACMDLLFSDFDASEKTYINFLNSGDSLHSELDLESLSNFIESTGKWAVYAGISERCTSGKQWLWYPHKTLAKVKWGMPFEHQAVYLRSDAIKHLRFDERYSLSGDYDFTCRLAKELNYESYAIYPHKVCSFSVGGASFTRRYEAILEGTLVRLRVNKSTVFRAYSLIAYFALLHLIKKALLRWKGIL